MTDVVKEIQKLKSLINQKQTTAVFSNKSNESTKLASGDTELFINDMSKKFSFSRAGVRAPIMIDPRDRTIENVEYINGARVSDITGAAFEIDNLRTITSMHAERIERCENKEKSLEESINALDGRIGGCETEIGKINDELLLHNNELVQHSMRLSELEKAEGSTEIMNSMITVARYEDLEYTYTYDDSEPGYFRITFTPAITIDNFRPSRRDVLVKCTLSNGFVWEPEFQKYWDAETKSYGLDLRGGELNKGVLRYYHGYTSATTTDVVVCEGILVFPIEGLASTRFTNAIVESTRYGMINEFITGEEDVPLDFTYTFDQTDTNACIITFSTSVSDENVIAGNYSFIEYELSNGTIHTIYYNKYQTDTGYEINWGAGSWDSTRTVYTINHGRGVVCVAVNVKRERFIKSKEYTLTDDRLTQAVVNSFTNDYLTYENITYKEVPITIGSISYSYDSSSYVYKVNIGSNVGPDNLKYGTHVKFAVLEVKRVMIIAQYFEHTITYTKTKNGNSYYLVWYSDGEVVEGITFANGLWTDAEGNIFRHLNSTSTQAVNTCTFEKDIYVNFETIKTTIIRPSPFRNMLVEFLYPVGSLYVSFDNTSPAERFGVGTWESIVNRFLYCSDESGTTGGSRLITIDNLPAHNHGIKNYYDDFNYNQGNTTFIKTSDTMSIPHDCGDDLTQAWTRTTYTENAGSGAEYMPEYMTVFAWRRTG